MFGIEQELKERLIRFNDTLSGRYKSFGDVKYSLQRLLSRYLGRLIELPNFTPQQVAEMAPRGIVAVDGSINSVGSSYPHYVALMRSMAQTTLSGYEPIYKYEVYSPLFETQLNDDENVPAAVKDENRRSAHMAQLEVEAAIDAVKFMWPSILMMDGSLAQFRIKCRQSWEKLRDAALEQNVLLVGIVEEIKTAILRDVLKDKLPNDMKDMYDRELLFGLLEPGQMLQIDELHLGQGKMGLSSCFVRTSHDPHPIAIDMLAEQSCRLVDMAALAYALTPKNGRGIPLWLDMVDGQVRITNQMMEALIDEYIDADVRHRLLVAKRQNREW